MQSENISTVKDQVKLFLNSVCDTIGKSDLRRDLEMSERKFNKVLSHGNINLVDLNTLSNLFGVVPDNFYDKNIDLQSAINFYRGAPTLPKKYLRSSYSKMRTMNNILKVLNSNQMDDYQTYFRSYFQVPVEDWLNDDTEISTLLLADLYKKIVQSPLFDDSDLYKIGLATHQYNKDSEFASIFEGKSFKQCYEVLADGLISYVEQSYKYKVVYVDDKKAIIRKWLSERMKDELKVNSYSNHETCLYSIGFAATIPYFSNGNVARGRKTKCIYRGDPYSEFIIERQDH